MKRIALWLLFCGVGLAQQTIYQKVLTSAQAAGTSIVVVNRGQAQHLLTVTVSSRPALTCNQMPTMRLEGSYDGINYVAISAALGPFGSSTTITAPHTRYISGYGIFPYIRANLLALDANCQVDAWYGGSLYPASPNDISMRSLGLTYNYVLSTISGESTILGTAPSAMYTTVYGMTLTNQTAATNGFSVVCKNVGTGVTSSTIMFWTAVPASSTILNWPASKQPYFQCPNTTDSLVLVTTGTGAVGIFVLYRYEE